MRSFRNRTFPVILLIATINVSSGGTDQNTSDAPLLQIADTVLIYQRSTGGWPSNYDRSEPLSKDKQATILDDRSKLDSTMDNGATHQEIRILAEAYRKSSEKKYRDAAMRGIQFLTDAQYDNGGWPQRYPQLSGYHQHITYNDHAMIGVMELFRDITIENENFHFVPEDFRKTCEVALEKGLTCILKTQVVIDGHLTAWCAQHDRTTLKPAKARSYELPSLSGSESVGIIRYLMGINNPDKNVVGSIEAAVAWFKRMKLTGIRQVRIEAPGTEKGSDKIVIQDPNAPPLWGRFYDLKTQKPFFCSRDGIPKSSLSDISYERRNGYSWLGEYARDLLNKHYPLWKEQQHR